MDPSILDDKLAGLKCLLDTANFIERVQTLGLITPAERNEAFKKLNDKVHHEIKALLG